MEILKVNSQLETPLPSGMQNKTNTGTTATGANANNANAAVKVQGQNIDQNKEQEQSLSEQLAKITQNLNKQMESLDANVRFGYSDKINGLYISVTEKNTGKEIRQIPSEEAMRLAEHFKDVIGTIFNKEA